MHVRPVLEQRELRDRTVFSVPGGKRRNKKRSIKGISPGSLASVGLPAAFLKGIAEIAIALQTAAHPETRPS